MPGGFAKGIICVLCSTLTLALFPGRLTSAPPIPSGLAVTIAASDNFIGFPRNKAGTADQVKEAIVKLLESAFPYWSFRSATPAAKLDIFLDLKGEGRIDESQLKLTAMRASKLEKQLFAPVNLYQGQYASVSKHPLNEGWIGPVTDAFTSIFAGDERRKFEQI